MKILTMYDGTIQAKIALEYGIKKAKEKRGELIVLQIFQSSLFVDYDAGPKAEEIARHEAKRSLEEAESIIREKGQGVAVQIVTEEGDPEQEIVRIAKREHADLVLAAPRYKNIMRSSPCPVSLISGTILVPFDNSDVLSTHLEMIAGEAESTGSRALLMGVVPIHLYSKEEKKELEELKHGIDGQVKKIKKALNERGVETIEIIRFGYPDEEIVKAAEEFTASLIMLPSGGKTPSELAKAAAILKDEPARSRPPIELMQAAEA